uniref:LNS2/PITP domain-containing protein n=1 Tax=Meloidogyne javanica TaxID=6303 RepID=A0A915MSP7_MELJA
MNSATLSGAIDVIVVEQPDGTMLSTPFHVRFGKYGVFNYDDKYVDIQINNEEIDLKMKLGGNGVAFFVEKSEEETELPSHLETSPLPDDIMETDGAARLTPSAKESKSLVDQTRPSKRSPRKDSAVVRPRKGSSSSDDELPLQKSRPPQQQRQKKMLPFSLSIYSCRKNRSLPDLSILPSDYNQNDINSQVISARVQVVGEGENGKKKSKHKRKATFGAIDMQKLINENNVVSKNVNGGGFHHSKSASTALKNVVTDTDLNMIPIEKLSPSSNSEQQSSPITPISLQDDQKEESKQSISPESSTKTTFFCSSDDDEEDPNSLENSKNNLLKPSNVGSDIADGALSDPEVDRQGNSPDMNDPEWKWGEIPKSSKTKDSSRSTTKKNEKQGRWNWFRWSRQPQQEEGEEATDGDLGNDPAKLEKYFGTRSGAMSISSNASNFDSGKGVSLGTSPSSAMSINDDNDTATLTGMVVDGMNKQPTNNSSAHSLENLTVTAENNIVATPATSTSSPSTLEKSKNVPTSRSRFDSGNSDASCATDLNLSDEEFIATTAEHLVSAASKKYKRSLRLSSDQLKLLNLDYGSNDARFSITTKFQKIGKIPFYLPYSDLDKHDVNILVQVLEFNFDVARLTSVRRALCPIRAIDVIVVEQPDGTMLSTPFHVRFGKYGVFNYDDKYVDIQINNEEIDLKMKLGGNGVAFFVENNATHNLFKLLKLKYSKNDARFSITTKFQGTAWCSCHIYLLRWCDKLVISDIDGTITKSDVLGHVIPAIGGTWAHSGVAELYTRIKNNGYQMVYLSSRAIGQSHYTKTYLQSIAQGSQTLPDGPVLLSPTSVLMAFKKEVIERRPEEFKIACLNDLKSLFPVDRPFFAGFGNRETDVKSYKAVDIPLERILIIDPSGMLRRADKIGYVSDYVSMAIDTVDYIFPPIPFLEDIKFSDPSLMTECRTLNFGTQPAFLQSEMTKTK